MKITLVYNSLNRTERESVNTIIRTYPTSIIFDVSTDQRFREVPNTINSLERSLRAIPCCFADTNDDRFELFKVYGSDFNVDSITVKVNAASTIERNPQPAVDSAKNDNTVPGGKHPMAVSDALPRVVDTELDNLRTAALNGGLTDDLIKQAISLLLRRQS